MSDITLSKHDVISLKDHPDLSETWLRDQIEQNPTILRLGNLQVKDIERMQPSAGRLDILLRDPETERRYEVEIMLGTLDEKHIVRTLEYWDIERKRYPQYKHVAVIAAENITGRFLNVIGLFNHVVPIIALQIHLIKVGDHHILHFAKVLDEIEPGEDDEDEAPAATATRKSWEDQSSKGTMEVVDECFKILAAIDDQVGPNYTDYYIGQLIRGRAANFVRFRPKVRFVRVEVMVRDKQSWLSKLEAQGFETLPGESNPRRVQFRLTTKELTPHRDLLKDLFKEGHRELLE